MQIVRSNDLFRGVPYNFVQFTSLQEILAGWLGIELGTYNQISDSLHLYTEDKKQILKSTVTEVQRNTDSISQPKLNQSVCLMKFLIE